MGKRGKGEPSSGDGEAVVESKSKGKLMPAVVLAVGLIGGGYFMGRGGDSTAAAAGTSAPTTTVDPSGGPIVMLNPITMNLSDGRYLKVGLALQLAAPDAKVAAARKDTKSGDADNGDGSATDPVWARALDATITELGGRSYSELALPDARRAAKEALGSRIAALYPDKVTGIYFTEFVMQ